MKKGEKNGKKEKKQRVPYFVEGVTVLRKRLEKRHWGREGGTSLPLSETEKKKGIDYRVYGK